MIKKIIKPIFWCVLFLLASVIANAGIILNSMGLYELGEFSQSGTFYYISFYLVTTSIFYFLFGFTIIIIQETSKYTMASIRGNISEKKFTIFSRSWPYVFAILLATPVMWLGNAGKNEIKWSTTGLHAKNGIKLYKGIKGDVFEEFMQNLMKNIHEKFEINPEEMVNFYYNLMEGKVLNSSDLKILYDYFVQYENKYFNQFNYFIELNDQKKFEAEFNNYALHNKKAQGLPSIMKKDILLLGFKAFDNQIKRMKENSEILNKSESLLLEIAKEFCLLLLKEEGHYTPPEISLENSVWRFKNKDAELKYNIIVEKINELKILEEEVGKIFQPVKNL